jgi:hypothetical protein
MHEEVTPLRDATRAAYIERMDNTDCEAFCGMTEKTVQSTKPAPTAQ